MNYSVVDLFCGIGGLTKGLELAGLNVVAGLDVDSTCRFAYEANNKSKFICSDVSSIEPSTINSLYPENHVKILVGCAPCQPFSKYTQRYRKNGQKDNKWKLLYSFGQLVENLKPTVVSMENVPELSNQTVFKDFVKKLEEQQYSVSWSIVYCPDYGVPQKRKRLVLLASKLGSIKLIPRSYTPNNYKTVKDTIENLPCIRDGEFCWSDPIHCATKLNKLNLERIKQSVPGGTWKDWDEKLLSSCHKKPTGKGYKAVYGRMVWNEPSPTITTQFYGFGNGRFGHPEQDRAISFREGALLQSFPVDYKFIEDGTTKFNKKNLGIHIGNAVPVELGRAIGISIIDHLNKEFSKLQ